MSYQILYNGIPFDLPPDGQPLLSTFAVNSLHKLSSRQVDFTDEFTLPQTAHNEQLLENASTLNSFSKAPYRKLPVQITESGSVVVYGTLQVLSSSGNNYQVRIIGGNRDFFQLLEDKSLQEVILSQYDHDWTLTNVLNSADHTWEDAYTYPAIDYGKLEEREYANGLTFDELFPAVFAKKLFLAIINQSGFVAKGSFLNDTIFNQELLPSSRVMQYDEAFVKARTTKASYAVDSQVQSDSVIIGAYHPVNMPLIFTQDTPSLTNDQASDGEADCYNPATGYYTADKPVFVNVSVEMKFDVWPTIGACRIKFILYKNFRKEVVGQHEQIFRAGLTGKRFQDLLISKSWNGILLNPGDFIWVQLQIERGSDAAAYVTKAFFNKDAFFTVTPSRQIPPGGRVTLSAMLPEIKQTEFFLTIVNQYNLLIKTDAENGVVYFDKFSKVTDNIAVAKDWSSKVDYPKEPNETYPRLTYLQENYGQRSVFRYAPDESDPVLSNVEGSSFIAIGNEHLPTEEIIFESVFAATARRGAFQGGALVPYIPLFKPKSNTRVRPYSSEDTYATKPTPDYALWKNRLWKCIADGTINAEPDKHLNNWQPALFSDVYDTLDPVPRILVKDPTNQTPIYIADPSQADVVHEYINNATFAPLSFEVLLKNHYGGLAVALKDGKYLQCLIRLTPHDIATLDFLRPVWIGSIHPIYGKYFNAYFYISSVNQYRHGSPESTLVDLMRIDYETAGLEAPPKLEDQAALLQENGAYLLQENAGLILL